VGNGLGESFLKMFGNIRLPTGHLLRVQGERSVQGYL